MTLLSVMQGVSKAERVRAPAAGLIDHAILATKSGVMINTHREGFAMPYNIWHM